MARAGSQRGAGKAVLAYKMLKHRQVCDVPALLYFMKCSPRYVSQHREVLMNLIKSVCVKTVCRLLKRFLAASASR